MPNNLLAVDRPSWRKLGCHLDARISLDVREQFLGRLSTAHWVGEKAYAPDAAESVLFWEIVNDAKRNLRYIPPVVWTAATYEQATSQLEAPSNFEDYCFESNRILFLFPTDVTVIITSEEFKSDVHALYSIVIPEPFGISSLAWMDVYKNGEPYAKNVLMPWMGPPNNTGNLQPEFHLLNYMSGYAELHREKALLPMQPGKKNGKKAPPPVNEIIRVTLRKESQADKPEPLTHRTVDWSHQWDVRGHWRQLKSGKMVQVKGHRKGPHDKPYIKKEMVIEVVR